MKIKIYSQCCHDVAVKHGLGTTLVTGHKAQYFIDAHNEFISQFTDDKIQEMALKKFPVEMDKQIEFMRAVDMNKYHREIYLDALRDLVKVMGGREG